MLEKEYKNYLIDGNIDDEYLNIKQVIVRLYKENKIDLLTAQRLITIFNKLVKLPNINSFKEIEKINYRTDNELEKIKLEVVFLLEKLMTKNIEEKNEEENVLKFKRYLNRIMHCELTSEDLKEIKRQILFVELDNGYDFKFLTAADEYLKENVKKYYKG